MSSSDIPAMRVSQSSSHTFRGQHPRVAHSRWYRIRMMTANAPQYKRSVPKLGQELYKPDRAWFPFTVEEDKKLLSLRSSGKTWKDICVPLGRSIRSCHRRHEMLTRRPMRTGRWSEEEDSALLQARQKAVEMGKKRWMSEVARGIGRFPNSVSHRLQKILPELNHTTISEEEGQHIREQVEKARHSGNPVPWAVIARNMRRSQRHIWNFWVTSSAPTLGGWTLREHQVLEAEVEKAAKLGIKPNWQNTGRMIGRVGYTVRARWQTLQKRARSGRIGRDRWTKDEERELLAFVDSNNTKRRVQWQMLHSKRSVKALRARYSALKRRT